MNTPKNIPPTFYDKPLQGNMNLDKLKTLIIERYNLLNAIFEKKEDSILYKYLQNFNWETNLLEDITTHFILALTFSPSESDRTWFINQETTLFQKKTKKYNIYETLKELGIPLKQFELSKNDDSLKKNIYFYTLEDKNEEIYTVNFEHALSLIEKRNYYLNKGLVYIPKSQISELLSTIFKEKLLKTINKISQNRENLLYDSRIRNLINFFDKYRERKANERENELREIPTEEKLKKSSDVDIYYKSTFPLCMYEIQKHINKYSHLMHFGRLQYTLFLKGTGLPVDECLQFFKKKYEKKTPGDKFDKMYAYNIRHSYGLEGKRSDYTPYSCSKILNMNNPNRDECHGCPFKIYSDDNLNDILNFEFKINPNDRFKIMEKKKNNEYQVACMKMFESLFKNEEYERVGIHPNGYFSSAMKILRKKKKIEYEKNNNNVSKKNEINNNNNQIIQNTNNTNNNDINNNN